MILRKNTAKDRVISEEKRQETRLKSVESLTALIKRRSTLSGNVLSNSDDEYGNENDETTPATNKLISLLKAPVINYSENIE